MDKLKMQAKPMDVVLKKVMEICPSAVQNGKVDFDRLREELSDVVDDSIKESYDFTWVGKRNSIVEANKPINKTLRPAKEESKNWDTTENLYIEGDNLEVLKLLQESYLNKVKMIYIDPPYNTGNDFVYDDTRVQSEDNMNEGIGLYDDEGNRQLSHAFVRNTETNGRLHSDWCSMMYPRLKLARDFLTDDGVIFISIDDNEISNLRKICDEIFGEDNFVQQIAWRRTDNQPNIGQSAKVKEYILVYAKNRDGLVYGKLPLSESALKEYRYEDAYAVKFRRGILLDKTRGRASYPVTTKSGKILNGPWMVSEEKFKEMDKNDEIYWTSGGDEQPYSKIYLKDSKGAIPNDFWGIEYGTNQRASLEVEALFNKRYFDFPKPVSLLKTLVTLGCPNSSDIILDFFSGSATTAHAVMQLNAEDGGKRKFIMVQLPEATDKDSEAFKAGYKNICQIGKERIRRAGEKILSSLRANGEAIQSKNDSMLKLDCHVAEAPRNDNLALDIGFRVLKLADSNMQDVYYTPAETSKKTLLDSVDNIKADRKPLDLLFGVMIDWGVSLSLALSEHKVGNNTVYVVGDNDLVACFNTNITLETITKMAVFNPTRAVFRDACFAKDDAKINMMEIFKSVCGWDEKQAKDSVKVI